MISFIFADLIVLPIIVIYRKYYGRAFAARIVALMLLDDDPRRARGRCGLFSARRPDPGRAPHARGHLRAASKLDYKLFTNVLGAVAALFACHGRGA